MSGSGIGATIGDYPGALYFCGCKLQGTERRDRRPGLHRADLTSTDLNLSHPEHRTDLLVDNEHDQRYQYAFQQVEGRHRE